MKLLITKLFSDNFLLSPDHRSESSKAKVCDLLLAGIAGSKAWIIVCCICYVLDRSIPLGQVDNSSMRILKLCVCLTVRNKVQQKHSKHTTDFSPFTPRHMPQQENSNCINNFLITRLKPYVIKNDVYDIFS
jgi:hypothetical protein